MKVNVYYGKSEEMLNNQLVKSFATFEEAEEFLKQKFDGKEFKKEELFETRFVYKTDEDENFYTVIKHIEVVAAIIFDNNKIFATQRGYGEFKDGWEFPGGKMEPGETGPEALTRELREELELKVEVLDLIKTINYTYPKFHLTMHCYKTKIVEGKPNLLEHEAACWVDKAGLDNIAWLPADLEVIDEIKAML